MTGQVHDRPDPPRPRTNRLLVAACWAGREPAESLPQRDREDLVYGLWLRRWTDVEIATHCRMTSYTTARIRERLGLTPHTQGEQQKAG